MIEDKMKHELQPMLDEFRKELERQRKEGVTDSELVDIIAICVAKACSEVEDPDLRAWLSWEFSAVGREVAAMPVGTGGRRRL